MRNSRDLDRMLDKIEGAGFDVDENRESVTISYMMHPDDDESDDERMWKVLDRVVRFDTGREMIDAGILDGRSWIEIPWEAFE